MAADAAPRQDVASRGSPPAGRLAALRHVGPGLVVAATGVGAGDVVAAAVAGSRFGLAVVWAAAAGALLKFVLNEGLARWQCATGTTLIEGWSLRLGRWVQWYFLGYLALWSFVVGGALISACGLAAHAVARTQTLTPQLTQGGVVNFDRTDRERLANLSRHFGSALSRLPRIPVPRDP